jgi:hypothetical protein
MKTKTSYFHTILSIALIFGFAINTQAQCLPSFGAASSFVLFTQAGAVGNTAVSTITGDVGSNTADVTGLNATNVNGVIHVPDAVTLQASTDLVLAYNQLLAIPATNSIHTPSFGDGETLVPGVYVIGAAGSVGGILNLDAQNNPNAIFIFRFGGALTTGAGSSVVLKNGAKAGNIFWIANGAIAMAATTIMSGTLIANGANSLGAASVINGRMYSIAGAVTTYASVVNATGIDFNRGGTLSANQTIYAGATPTDFTLSANEGNVVKWQKSLDINFTAPTDMASTATTLTASEIGAVNAVTYFRAVTQKASCPLTYSTLIKVAMLPSTNWNGTAWSNGPPAAGTETIINGTYATNSGDVFTTSRLTVNPGGSFKVKANTNLIVENEVINNAGATGIVIENNGNLIQLNNTINSGAITVNRNCSALLRLDYTLWSSPVSNSTQYLQAFSPDTATNRFSIYNTSTNQLNAVPNPDTTPFATGIAYSIRMPNTTSATVPTIYSGIFNGLPNNGAIAVHLNYSGVGFGFNMVGNPYPSPIDMNKFVSDNAATITGTLYFWRKTNNTNSPSYCSWTAGTFVSNNESQVQDPNSILQTGQGFFVEAKAAGTTLLFKNTQRDLNTGGKFFKTKQQTIENNRIWLNATDAMGHFSQMAVGYTTHATQGVDAYDGLYNNDGALSLNSYLDNTDYVIQGRALPFDAADVVPLSFSTTLAGTYSIALDHVDGLFSGTQAVFLVDSQTGTETNLKTTPYTFTATAGATTTRFALKYQKTLGNNTLVFDEDSIRLYKNKNFIQLQTNGTTLSKVKIFEISGKLVFEKDKINASEMAIESSNFTNQILVLQITSEDNKTIFKKYVN